MKWTVLSDNRTSDSRLETEHGLSILLETKQLRVLLDTGASDVFARNAEKLGVDIRNVDYVFIHDGARPFVTGEIVQRAYEQVKKTKACVVGMPVKDTIKIADEEGFAKNTPNRNLVWAVQTPQVFEFSLIKAAYEKLIEKENSLKQQGVLITDDAMVAETFTEEKVKLVEGSYENIKITTPEDLKIAEVLL